MSEKGESLQFTDREIATILAALLFCARRYARMPQTVMRPYFETLGLSRFEPLSADEIFDLSERLLALVVGRGD